MLSSEKRYRIMTRFGYLTLCLSLVSAPASGQPWSTYRGNSQRTGNTDGVPGPTVPQVLWVLKSQENFIAAPVPAKKCLFIAGLGAFNVPSLTCLATDVQAPKRTLWSKTVPYLKLPTVSSPARADDKLVFGDGMHQTDGAVLYCLQASTGLPLWQLPVPGRLVHLEGSPTISGRKVFIGGGSAGVMCVHLTRVTFHGKEQPLDTVQRQLAQQWQDLLKAYEKEKQKDPDFAVPPSEDQLDKPEPVKVWAQGQSQWHVDAPVAVAGDTVLAASAFLEKEKIGDRALLALDAATGALRWRTPLRLNPWGGPSVAGGLVIVSGSTIGFDPKAIPQAIGDVTALDLATGTVKWRKEVPGGVLGCVAVASGLAVATATDGRVRAFDLASGAERWSYDRKAPFFAPAAVVGGLVYAGDLEGVVHAIRLDSGQPAWHIDLGKDARVQAPGMIYGGPVVEGGRIFLATCNVEGPHAHKATAVVCIGPKE
jgi:outer membrane protein assembly factor BamB